MAHFRWGCLMSRKKSEAGESFEQILEAYPRLTEESIRAAIAFAVEVLRTDVVYPIQEIA